MDFNIFILLITQYRGYIIQYFNQAFDCTSLTEIGKVGGSFSINDQCSSSCKLDDNSKNIFSLTVSSNQYAKGLEIVKDLTNDHSIVGVDLVYYTSEKFYIEIYDGSQFVEKILINKSILNNYLQEQKYSFQCGFNPLTSLHFQYKINRKFTTKKFKILFTGFPATYGFLKIKIWQNCVENCLTCQDSQNCSTCQPGFQLYQLSTGQYVCSEIKGCKQSNCFQCARSLIPSFEICLSCFPGYTLNSSNECIQNTGSCKTTQYRDSDGICKNYSASCKMQNPLDNTKWQQCEQIPVIEQIKCPKDKNILLYDIENYLIRNCGCTDTFCAQCTTTTKCDKCVTGYIVQNNQCTFDRCPIGQVQNLTTLLCQSQEVCTTNCSVCTSTECTTCKIGNYYIKKDDKKTCQECSISNCASCDTSGLCIACNTGFSINSPKTQCFACQVNNCKQCSSSDPLKCNICNTNYELNIALTECKCKVTNCIECTPEDGFKCKQCAVGYQNTGSQCLCSVDNCIECDANNGAICKKCQNPNQILENGQCVCKIKDCLKCDQQDKCELCKNGMYFNPQTKKCTCKIKDCVECISDIMCTKCAINYDDSDKKMCKCSVPNCESCKPDNGSICEKCNLNFEPKNTDQCAPTVNNCIDYSKIDGSKCITCEPNYTVTNNKCVPQVDYCAKGVVNDGSKCEECIKGYKLNQNKDQCICELINCSKCDPNNGTVCLECIKNYKEYNSNKECRCSVSNCQNCNINDGQLCDKCQNQYLESTDKKSCILNCPDSNCLEFQLLPNNITKCKKCLKGYVIDSATYQCVPCLAPHCEQCIENNQNQCQICIKNYEVTSLSNNQCQLQTCEVVGCNQCDPNNLKKCLVCINGFILDANGICVQFQENKFDIQQKQTLYGNNITIIFERNAQYNKIQSIDDIIKYSIVNFKDYDSTITKINNKEVLISLQIKQDCKGQYFSIKLDSNFAKVNNIAKEQDEIKLINFAVVSESQIKQAEQTKAVTESVKTTLMTTMVPIAMIGNFYVLFNTIDLTTFIYYLLYVKVRYPINITNFCGVFQNFQMAFIPNLFQVYWLDGYTQASTPAKFLENGADAYFLNGGGQSITIILGILTIYMILKIISSISIYPPFQLYVQSKIESGWEYCGFFDLTWTVYMYVLVSCFLQLFKFDFDDSLCFLNYSLWTLFSLAVLFIPIWITIFIIQTEDLNDTQIQKQYGSIIGGLVIPANNYENRSSNQLIIKGDKNEKYFQSNIESLSQVSPNLENEIICLDSPGLISNTKKTIQYRQRLQFKWSRFTNVFLYFRKILYAIFIIFLSDFPYLQLFTISLLNLFLAIHYFYIRPHQNNVENIRNGLSEAMLIIMQCTICLLVNDNEDEIEQDRINIGWVLIACASSILLLHIIFVVLDLLRGVYNLIKDFVHILIKFKQGFFENKRKQEEEKQKQQKAEMFAGMIPTVMGSNIFKRSETKRFTGMFIQNLNNSILNSPRRNNRRMTQDQSFQVSANATTRVLELFSQKPLQLSPKNKNQKFDNEANFYEMSMMSNSKYNLYEKRRSQLSLNQDLDISMSKVRSQGDK